jgi:hypothetical protein
VAEEPKSNGSWLDEVSFATKLVVVVTVLAIVGFALVRIFELFF